MSVRMEIFFFHLYVKTEKAQQREKNLEEAKKVTIKEDESLPKARRVSFLYKKNVGYKKWHTLRGKIILI